MANESSTPGKLRLIQAGVGGHGAGWVRNQTSKSADFDLVAIADVSEKALYEAGDAIGLPRERRFASLHEAIAAVPADAVLTVTPPAIHLEHARLAFSRGLHLMTEKPIADTVENAKAMVKLAAEANRQLVVTQNYRFKSTVRLLRKLIDEKAVGSFGHGHLDFYIPGDFTGSFRETMDYPLLVDMAIHHMDLIRAVTGKNIERVTAVSFRPEWSWYRHDPGLKMLMELEGGIPFSYSGDWAAKGRCTSWDGNWRLQCADGAIHWEDNKVSVSRSEAWCRNISIAYPDPTPMERGDQAHLLHAFAESIRTGKPAETSGADNLYSFGAVSAGVVSAKEHRTVAVRDLIDG